MIPLTFYGVPAWYNNSMSRLRQRYRRRHTSGVVFMGKKESLTRAGFFEENFIPFKTKDKKKNYRIGKHTHSWLCDKEKRKRFSHLTEEDLDALVARYFLKKVDFDDGKCYIVKPEIERDILVRFYQEKEEESGERIEYTLRDTVPVRDDDLLEKYRISAAAVEAITGDTSDELELNPHSAVDFIPQIMIIDALFDGKVKMYLDEGYYTIIASDEDYIDKDVFALHAESPIPGTEVPISELDVKQKTAIIGMYRDQVIGTGHDFSEKIEKIKE